MNVGWDEVMGNDQTPLDDLLGDYFRHKKRQISTAKKSKDQLETEFNAAEYDNYTARRRTTKASLLDYLAY